MMTMKKEAVGMTPMTPWLLQPCEQPMQWDINALKATPQIDSTGTELVPDASSFNFVNSC